MRDEKTIDFTLDKLDFEPNSIFGFTMTEFLKCSGALCTVFGFFLGFVSAYALDFFMYGLIAGVMIGVLVTTCLAYRGETYKKGRPSYMIWVDLRHWAQFKLGIKMSFYESRVWDTCYDRRINQQKKRNAK